MRYLKKKQEVPNVATLLIKHPDCMRLYTNYILLLIRLQILENLKLLKDFKKLFILEILHGSQQVSCSLSFFILKIYQYFELYKNLL